MAAAYSLIGGTTPIADIKAALNAKSLITSVLYETTSVLIFSSPLTSKVIKIKNVYQIKFSYGDAWTSGETITNEVSIMSSEYGEAFTITHFVADTTYFAFFGDQRGYYVVCYFGALDNDDVITLALSNGSFTGNACRNITTGNTITPIYFNALIKSAGKYLAQPLLFKVTSTDEVILNGSSPAQALGIKNLALISNTTPIKGATFVYSVAPLSSGLASAVGFTF